jgi:hypothetical protein
MHQMFSIGHATVESKSKLATSCAAALCVVVPSATIFDSHLAALLYGMIVHALSACCISPFHVSALVQPFPHAVQLHVQRVCGRAISRNRRSPRLAWQRQVENGRK